MLFSILLLVLGFVLLIKGADWLVEGASSIARRFGLSDLMIGLTVVSFGTSAPELIVNIFASVQGNADIAVGNIIGSNISNTLLILGITALISPLVIQRSTVLKEIPFGLLAAVILYVMANDILLAGYTQSELTRGDGIVFLCFFIIFMYYTFGMKRQDHEGYTKPTMPLWHAWSILLVGLIGLSVGGHLAVEGAKRIALDIGISETLVGLTIVALGTSLPELAASITAAMKGKADIAVGNIAGSNIFNIFWILGLSSVIKPLPFQPMINFDLSIVVFSTLLLFFLIHNGGFHHRLFLWWKQERDYILNRSEGAVLLVCYFAYIGYIIMRDLGIVVAV